MGWFCSIPYIITAVGAGDGAIRALLVICTAIMRISVGTGASYEALNINYLNNLKKTVAMVLISILGTLMPTYITYKKGQEVIDPTAVAPLATLTGIGYFVSWCHHLIN